MRIIGSVKDGVFLAEVHKYEIEKVFDKFYANMPPVQVGDVLNISAGHDFRNDIKSACVAMIEASRKFEQAQKTIMAMALLLAGGPSGEKP